MIANHATDELGRKMYVYSCPRSGAWSPLCPKVWQRVFQFSLTVLANELLIRADTKSGSTHRSENRY